MKHWYEKVLSITFVFAISTVLIYGIVSKDADVSYYENRTLSYKPAFTKTHLLSGHFMRGYEKYFNDQFPGRALEIKYFTQIELMLNKTFVHYLRPINDNNIMHSPANEKSIEELSGNINQLTKLKEKTEIKNGEFYYFLAPHKTNALAYLLPSYVDISPYENNLKNLKILSKDFKVYQLYNILNKNNNIEDWESLYFRSGHHWNMDGAILGYKEIIDTISKDYPSLNPVNIDEYKRKVIDVKKYMGSWNSNLIDIIDPSIDDIIYYETELPQFTIKYGKDESDLLPSSYEEIYATGITKNKNSISYVSAYMEDYPILTIEQEGNDNNLKVLIIKDSYANPIIFHLANNFSETTVIDVRHYKSTVAEHLKNNNYDIVLVLYSDNTLNKNMYQFGF